MSVFLDTGILDGALDPRDQRHADASHLLEAALRGRHGAVVTNTLVVAEAFNLLRARRATASSLDALAALLWPAAAKVRRPPITVLDVAAHSLPAVARLQARHAKLGLSFTDCSILAAMHDAGIGSLATFDGAFAGLIDVIAGAAPTE